MAIVDELIAVLGYEIRGEQAAKRYEKSIDRLNNRLAAFSAGAVRYGAVIGTALGAAMGALGRSVVTTSAEFEGYQATLETIEGSAEKAKSSLDWISEFGKTTPYDVAGVTDAFVKLKAYGIDPIANDALRILGDTASAMNKPLNQAVEAFADAATGEFERLKEFGITSKTQGDKVTFSWTKNGKELTKTVKKNSEEIRKFLLETMGDRFSGAMERQSKTWDGMMSNLGDTWTDFKRRIGDAGFFKTIKGYLKQLLDYFDKLDKDGTLDRWAKNISLSLETGAIELAYFMKRMKKHFLFIKNNFAQFELPLKSLGVAVGLLLARLFPLTTVLLLAGIAVDDFLGYLQGGESRIGDFTAWLQQITGVSEDVAQGITALGGSIAAALSYGLVIAPLKSMGVFRRILLGGIMALGPAVKMAVALLFTPAGFLTAVVGLGAALVWYFWDDLKAAWNTLSGKVSELSESFGNWFEDATWSEIFIRTAFPLTNFFWDELVAGWNALSGKVSQLAADFGNWFENASWTEVFIRVASPLTNFFWDELVTGWNGLSSMVSQLAGDLTSWISGVDWSQVFGPAGLNAVNGFWLDFKDAFGTLKDQVTVLFNQISDWVVDINWVGVGQSIIDGIGTGIKNSIGFLLDIIENALRENGYDFVANLVFGNSDEKAKPAKDPGVKTTGEVVSDHKQARLTDDAWDLKLKLQKEEALRAVGNFQANLAKTGSSEAAQAIANDNRQDNRDQSMTNNVTIHQQVMEVAQAPAALARASGKAVSGGVSKQRSQIETDPAF